MATPDPLPFSRVMVQFNGIGLQGTAWHDTANIFEASILRAHVHLYTTYIWGARRPAQRATFPPPPSSSATGGVQSNPCVTNK